MLTRCQKVNGQEEVNNSNGKCTFKYIKSEENIFFFVFERKNTKKIYGQLLVSIEKPTI